MPPPPDQPPSIDHPDDESSFLRSHDSFLEQQSLLENENGSNLSTFATIGIVQHGEKANATISGQKKVGGGGSVHKKTKSRNSKRSKITWHSWLSNNMQIIMDVIPFGWFSSSDFSREMCLLSSRTSNLCSLRICKLCNRYKEDHNENSSIVSTSKLSKKKILKKIQAIYKRINFKKLALIGIVALAWLLMEYGTDGSYLAMDKSPSISDAESPSSPSQEYYRPTAGFEEGDSTKRGYQARSQVPIPVEYSNFVELSEFSDAVAVVRLHRHQMLQGRRREQKESEEKQRDMARRRRRLRIQEEASGQQTTAFASAKTQQHLEMIKRLLLEMESNDEEDKMTNAIDASWEKAIRDNPDITPPKKKVHHVPFFWHIPRCGGTTLSNLFGSCLSLIQASSSLSSPLLFHRDDDEALASRFRDPTMYIVRREGQQFANVDLNSLEGVMRAAEGKLIQKAMAEVVLVPNVRLGSLLFGDVGDEPGIKNGEEDQNEGRGEEVDYEMNAGTPREVEFKGVLFTMFRHPIERTASWFYHKQSVQDSVHYDPSLEIYSLTDWINSPSYMTDYMVRTLVGKVDTHFHLVREDLDVAKEILRRKCLVGLLDEKSESMRRFIKFFGWNAELQRDSIMLTEGEETAEAIQAERWHNQIVKDEECQDRLLHWDWMNKHKHPVVEEGSLEYKLLESKNRYDLELYMYARQLFEEQFTQLGFDDDAIHFEESGAAVDDTNHA